APRRPGDANKGNHRELQSHHPRPCENESLHHLPGQIELEAKQKGPPMCRGKQGDNETRSRRMSSRTSRDNCTQAAQVYPTTVGESNPGGMGWDPEKGRSSTMVPACL